MTPLFAFLLQTGGGGMASLLMMAAIFGVFYFLLIMPQQRRQKKWQAMLGELKAGGKVITSGGIKGTILSVKEDAVQLRVPPDNLRLEVTRSAIVSMAEEQQAS